MLKNHTEFTDKSKRFTTKSAEANRQVEIHRRQISIINQKLSDAIMREETALSKVNNILFFSRVLYKIGKKFFKLTFH